jgi:hypothetical protein
MAATATRSAHILGDTVFRSPDETHEFALRSDGVLLKRAFGHKTWRLSGTFDLIDFRIHGQLRRRGYTEHRIDDDGDVIG